MSAARAGMLARVRGWLATRLGDSLHALGRVAREPDLRRLLLAQVASLIGQWGSTVAVAVWAFNRGGAGLVGVATFVRMMPAAIIGPFTGLVADRLPRLRVMIGCGAWTQNRWL